MLTFNLSLNSGNLETLIALLIAGLATYRLAFMVSSEAGPFNFFETLRSAIAKAYLAKATPIYATMGNPKEASGENEKEKAVVGYKNHWLVDGVNCPLCVGFWISPVMLGMLASGFLGLQLIVFWLFVAGVQTYATKRS